MDNVIPDDLKAQCIAYYGSLDWFYIRNDKLEYKSPIRVIREGYISKVSDALIVDIVGGIG